MAVLDVGCPADGTSFEDHNQRVLHAHDEVDCIETRSLWSPEAHQIMTLALRRLRTEAIARRLK